VSSNEDRKKMRKEFYESVEELNLSLISLLQDADSRILKDYCSQYFDSFVYSNLVLNFFRNLNQKTVKDGNLPKGKIKKLRKYYADTIAETEFVLSKTIANKKINENYYNKFKLSIKKNFPAFIVIIKEMEKTIDIKYLKEYVSNKKREIQKIKTPKRDYESNISTNILEAYVKNGRLPLLKKDTRDIARIFKKSFNDSVSYGIKILEKNSIKTAAAMKRDTSKFEKDIYKEWKEPLDLLALLVNFSAEIGEKEMLRISKDKNTSSKLKNMLLINIHARVTHVSNEILSLLRSGYPDGAYARWRTLYELTAIFLVLQSNDESLSKRYLDHSIVKTFKVANDFRTYHSRLHRSPFSRRDNAAIEDKYNKLKNTHGKEFKNDYGWIPKEILNDCSFKSLTKIVGIDHYLPFYNLSLDSAHGGPRGFHRMGLTEWRQKKVLLYGPSIYGLADPIQDTAYCLTLVNATLLLNESDFHNVWSMHLLKFFDKIGIKAVSIQERLERQMR
jgi:hypothetical protein